MSSKNGEYMVEVEDLHKGFEGNQVLEGVTCQIPAGKISVVMGPSGTGKSVLLRHVVGLLYPDKGDVRVAGKSVPSLNEEELLELRADLSAGRLELEIDQGSFALAEHLEFLEREADGIAAFRARQDVAFGAEREAWIRAGEFAARPETAAPRDGAVSVPAGAVLVQAPLSASVWQVDVRPGEAVSAGQRLLTLEAMKMETPLESPVDGEVLDVLVGSGDQVVSGAGLVVLSQHARD